MNKCKYRFRKADFLYGGKITFIIGVLALVLVLLGFSTDAFDPVGKALRSFRLSDGFFYSRAIRERNNTDVNPGIVLVDIKNCDSRDEIAEIVNRINESSPRLLAVDIIFGKAAGVASEVDSLLTVAFQASGNLILAQRVLESPEGVQVERSFFADKVDCVEGDVSFDYGTVRSLSSKRSVCGIEYPSFVAQVARIGKIRNGFDDQLINYSPIQTICLGPENLSDISLLKDQIVILGDSEDLRDFHDIPVLINGKARTSGMMIIAQSLYTLRPNNSFTNCPRWLAIIIGILLTYLFCTFFASPMYRRGKFNGLWISIWQVIVLVFLVGIAYILFWSFHLNVTLIYWLLGVGLAEFATEFFYFIRDYLLKKR